MRTNMQVFLHKRTTPLPRRRELTQGNILHSTISYSFYVHPTYDGLNRLQLHSSTATRPALWLLW